jgi:hypothetical protein
MSTRSGFAEQVLSNRMSGGFVPIIVGDYESISTVSVSANVPSVTFSSIPQTYKHLQIRAMITPGSASGDSFVYANFNNDVAANYAFHWLSGNSSAAGSSNAINQSTMGFGVMTGAGNSSLYPAPTILDILDYSVTSKFKTSRSLSGISQNTNVGGTSQLYLFSGLWRSTSAITSINFTPNPNVINFTAGTHFALYGIK